MNRELAITILCDNIVYKPRLLAEHGFSAFIEIRRGEAVYKLLFDTGQGMALQHNAGVLGMDLTNLTAIVLSHGHYDHAGGLENIILPGCSYSVFAHPHIFKKKYKQEVGKRRYTGIPWQKTVLESKGVQFHLVRESKEILPGVFLSGEMALPGKGRGLQGSLVEDDGNLCNDYFRDELALFLTTSKGVVVVTGCGHPGVERILETAVKVTGKEEIYALLGGLHLVNANREEITAVSKTVKHYGIKEVVICHCTGYRALEVFREVYYEDCQMGEVGFVWSC